MWSAQPRTSLARNELHGRLHIIGVSPLVKDKQIDGHSPPQDTLGSFRAVGLKLGEQFLGGAEQYLVTTTSRFVPDGFHRVRLADAWRPTDNQILFLADEMTGRKVSQHRGR